MHIHELKRHDVTINLVIGRTSNICYIQCTCTTVGLSLPKAIQFKDCILRWNLANKRTKSKHWPFHIHNNQQGTDQDNDISHFPSETTSKFWVFLQVEHIVTRKGYSSSFNKVSEGNAFRGKCSPWCIYFLAPKCQKVKRHGRGYKPLPS